MTTTEASRPVVAIPPDIHGFRRSVAVVIGIDAYAGDIPRLKSAANDATHLARLLSEQHHYDDVRLLTNEQASGAALRKLLATELAELVGDDGQSRLLFYFAGHGLAAESNDGRPAGYLVPQDATRDVGSMLPMADLLQALDQLTCRHLLLVLDCCFAGAIRWSSTRSLGIAPRAKLYRERYLRYLQGRAWQVLTSAAADERASDFVSFGERASAPDEGHSPFALALYDGLAGHADLPFDAPYGDGVITASDLAEYLNEQVTLHAIDQQRTQTPQIWELPRHGKGEYVFLVPGTQSLDLPPTPNNIPYRGLEPFDEAHDAYFAGREYLAERLYGEVLDLPLTVIAGASGIGKSSLLSAGLLPLLRADTRQAWEILPPVLLGETPAQLFDDLALPPTQPATLSARVGAWAAAHPETKLVLALDEFERLVRWPADQRERVLAELASALQEHSDQLRVVLSLRAADLAAFHDGPLKPLWPPTAVHVLPLEEPDIRRAIIEPAAKNVMFFEPEEQINWISNQIRDAPGALPLLSLTLRQLYQRALQRNADDRTITADDFNAVGGVTGALRTHASEVYDALNEAQRSTARRVLLRLVQVDGDTTTRRAIGISELEYADAAETERVLHVLRQLADARLIVIGAGQDGAATIELAHDTLIREWDKLNTWVAAERPALDLRRQLGEANADWMALQSTAHTWRQRRKAARRLWTDDRLDQVAAVLRSPRSWLNAAEQRFVKASLDRRLGQQWRSRVSLIATAAVMTLLALAALGWAVIADEAQQLAKHRALVAEARTELDQGYTGEALALALAAVAQPSHQPESEVVLSEAAALGARRRLAGHTSEVLSVAYGPDGKTIASGDNDGTLLLWDTATGNIVQTFTGHDYTVNSVAFSPDGRMLLSGSYDQTVRLWDVATGKEIRQFDDPGDVTSVAFSPDGKTAVSSGYDGRLILWNVADGREIAQFREEGEPLYSAVFSPDGRSILVASADKKLRLWDVASEQLIRTFAGHTDEVNTAAFSPDGKTIISGSDDRTLRLWDVSSGAQLGRFIGHDNLILAVAFSPDGRTAASSSGDQTIRLWDVAMRQELRRFEGHQGGVDSVAFSPDGRSIISGSYDHTVRLWDVAPGQELRQLPVPNLAIIQSIVFTPDGTAAATIADDGTLSIWDVSTGRLLRSSPISDDPSSISNLVVTPDGSEAYYYTESGEISVWDVRSATEITRTAGFESDDASLSQVAISPDGNQILYATSFVSTTTVFYYNWDTGASRELEGHTADVTSLAFSADGKTALSGSRDRTIRQWDIATGKTIKVFRGHARSVTSVAFSPDGKTIISGSDDRTIRLWDAETGREHARLVGHSGPVTSVALSPDGRTVLSGSHDGTLRLWHVETLDELIAWIHANRDVPALPCSVSADFGLEAPPDCVGTATPEPTAIQ